MFFLLFFCFFVENSKIKNGTLSRQVEHFFIPALAPMINQLSHISLMQYGILRSTLCDVILL